MSENVPNIGPVKIQIKKNLGITHALKDLVEQQKMELSDGKITAKEWNAVLDKLIEIQQNRKANGQASIFGGGTDKTRNGWHNSFIVHPNQEIEFTADEIGQLYEAMGAKFTKASKPVTPAETPVAQPEAHEGTGQKPAGNVEEEKRTDENGNEYTAQIREDGKEVARKYSTEDGDYTVSIEYDENGNKTREVETGYNTDKPKYIREYDSEGNKTKETELRGDGTTWHIKDYENDKLKTVTFYRVDGKTVNFKYLYEYDSEGNETKRTRLREDGTTDNIYDYENDKVKTVTFYREDSKTVISKRLYEYDSEGNKTKETELRGDGTTWYIEDYENGNLKTKTYYDADGKTPVKIIENDQLKMLKLKSKTENGATVINQYNFDENGVCTSSTLANSLHKQISGPSLNRNTIAFLKQLTPENVLKVLTSYEAMAGESLIDAISDEWGLNDEQFNDDMKVKDLIPTLVAERAKQLGFEPDENGQYNLDELFEADIQQSKESG